MLPAEAQASLLRARDHLQLLTRLTAARIAYDAAELELSQDALVHSFHRLGPRRGRGDQGGLARDVDEVIKAARCQR